MVFFGSKKTDRLQVCTALPDSGICQNTWPHGILPSSSVEEEATRIQQERLTAEEENRTLRETVFESQGRARAAEAALKRVQAEAADRDKQLRIMTDQNAELLRLLEQEEAQTARLSAANEVRTRWRWGELTCRRDKARYVYIYS